MFYRDNVLIINKYKWYHINTYIELGKYEVLQPYVNIHHTTHDDNNKTSHKISYK